MTINKSLYSSNKDNWETPKKIFDDLNKEFNFTIDLAADYSNALCAKYYSLKDNALEQTWTGRGWLNPPYGRQIGKWVQKAYLSVLDDTAELIVMLIPSRTDTLYWHDYILHGKATEIRFVKGRLKFSNSKTGAPFPSAVIVFKQKSPGLYYPPGVR